MSAAERGDRWAETMRRLAEAARGAASEMDRLCLVMNPELNDWDAEMTNCYPNWPE